jgi:tetratricopeptide (TPR) repeat protein
MSVKYRVRLQNDRIIGPFTAEEIGELFLKNHIFGNELCQQFPIGDWRAIETFPGLKIILSKLKKQNLTITKIEQRGEVVPETTNEKTLSEVKTFNEFKFGKNVKIDVDYAELEKKYKIDNPGTVSTVIDEGLEKTQILSRPNRSKDIDKTVVVISKAFRPIKGTTQAKKAVEVNDLEQAPEKKNYFQKAPEEIKKVLTEEDLMNEDTEFINLSHVLPSINAQLSVSEVELDQKARIEEVKEKIRLKHIQERLIREEENGEEDNDEDYGELNNDGSIDQASGVISPPIKKRKKGMSVIVALAFLGIFYILMTPEEKPRQTGPLYVDIKFPITQEFEDKVGASKALVQGRTFYAKGTYAAKVVASNSYLLSLQKQFSNNEALGELVLTYSEIMDDSKDPKISANTIYKLIQISDNKILTDLNVATGTALFYGKIGKHQTGINIIKNYLRSKSPVSSKMMAYYLELLINSGDLVEAKKIYNKIKDMPKKPIEAYLALAKLNDIDDQPAEAQTLIEEGLKYYPNSAALLLRDADYLFQNKSPKAYEQILIKCLQNNVESSPRMTAKLYSHLGLLNALKGKNKEAANFFKKSLAISETEELRSMLSSLEVGGDKLSQTLILESKVLALIKKAKSEINNKNLETAFSLSIEAVDADPDFIPAILLQTQLQLKRGLFDSAINTLQKAISLNPGNATLKKNLVQAYIKSYKFEDAQKILIELSQLKFATSSDYASLMGDFYEASGNAALAVRWYGEALNRYPLSDADLFKLAKIFIRLKKFSEAKSRISKALVLDPKNPSYLAANADIMFEQDNTDTAIGYLRDAISEIGEDPKLLSEIATLYYRSGQIKEFQAYFKRIQQMPKKDETFYEFLMYAAKLEEKKDDYINYGKDLLKFNPGNLKVRLELGEYYYQMKKFPEAIAEFDQIREKLASYPRVHYMLARIYLATNDIKKAKEMALKELELNPSLDSAYFIVGEVARTEKDYREAVLKYEKAISLNPKSTEALMAMGWIRLSQNYANEAIELYNRALKEDKTNPEIHKQMGFAYKAAGQRALAKEKFEDYLKLTPGAIDRDQIESQIKNLQ